MRCLCLFIAMLCHQLYAEGQSGAQIGREIDFATHLMSRGELSEALYVLAPLNPSVLPQRDSLHYLRGTILFQQKRLLDAAMELLSVSAASPLFHKSFFYGTYSLAHGGQAASAKYVLQDVAFAPASMREGMQNFQLGGIALMERDMEAFEQHAGHFEGLYHAFAVQEQSLQKHAESLRTYRRRSPIVGGVLSAVIPGLGKVYAGRTAEGIAGFLYVAAMSAVAYDFYQGAGLKSPWFIAGASVAATFYVGNIWGSAVAARRQNEMFNYEMDQRILFDLHIPLRNAFK